MALAGVVGFALNDSVDWVVAGCLVIGSSAGAVAGTRVLRRLQGPTLTYLFVAVMLVAAVRLLFGEVDTSGRDGLDAAMAVGLVALGLVAGFLAGLLGVGGGVVMVPGQILLFGIADAVAKGTSLAVILPTALVATWRNLRHDNADVRVGATVGVAGMLAAFAAAQVSVRLDPGVSTTLFGIFLLIVAARMALTARREARARAT